MWNPIRAVRERARRMKELEARVEAQDILDARTINCTTCDKCLDGQIGIVDDLISPLVRAGVFKRLRETNFYCNATCASRYYHEHEPIKLPAEEPGVPPIITEEDAVRWDREHPDNPGCLLSNAMGGEEVCSHPPDKMYYRKGNEDECMMDQAVDIKKGWYCGVCKKWIGASPPDEKPDGRQCETCGEYSNACVCICVVEEREEGIE